MLSHLQGPVGLQQPRRLSVQGSSVAGHLFGPLHALPHHLCCHGVLLALLVLDLAAAQGQQQSSQQREPRHLCRLQLLEGSRGVQRRAVAWQRLTRLTATPFRLREASKTSAAQHKAYRAVPLCLLNKGAVAHARLPLSDKPAKSQDQIA